MKPFPCAIESTCVQSVSRSTGAQWLAGLGLSIATMLTACRTNDVPTGIRGAASSGYSLATPASQFASRGSRNLDDDFEVFAKTVPGFGGLYYDKGRLVVVLTDTTKGSTIGGAISNFLARYDPALLGKAASDVASMRIQHGDYNWTQLAQWNRQLLQLGAMNGVTQTDIDEVRNRISIGVIDDAAAVRARAELSRLSVPPSAVIVEHIPPTVLLSDSLVGRVRPVGGGVAIQNATTQLYCTLGYNVYYRNQEGVYDGNRYFITASHCTQNIGIVNGDIFGQPSLSNAIGYEVDDPYLWDSDSSSTCPVGLKCRYSDAAAIQYYDSAAWKEGYIAETGTSYPYLFTTWRSIRTEGDDWGLYSGISVEKVGVGTGQTTGTIKGTCVNVHTYVNGSPDGRYLLCQAQTDMSAGPGDSGAGVFHVDTSLDADPLIGVLWGSAYRNDSSSTGVVLTTFAHWYNATWELARFKGGGWFDSILGACGGCGYSIRRPKQGTSSF